MHSSSSSSPAHTPGPWVFDPACLVVFDAPVKLGVATVQNWNNRPEAIANGRLIAAALELLLRCKLSLADAADAVKNPAEAARWNWESIAEDLRSVIAIAEGR